MNDLDDKQILITGGTGSFGRAFVAEVLRRAPKIARLVIFSRDELKQFEMSQQFNVSKHPGLRYFIGDVRDLHRLRRAMEGIDIVIHAAALKQVTTAEYNPFEYIKTNVLGAQNLIEAVLDSDVKRVVVLSTDKAASPINLYGATKLCSDKLFVSANNIRGRRDLRLSIVRYGNVFGSRGSVVPLFLALRKTGVLPITDPGMTRFNISLDQGVEMVLWALRNAKGGEIFVPKIPSYRVIDLAEAIAPECEQRIVGIRPGEKIHEEMITQSDSYYTVDRGDYFAIFPQGGSYTIQDYCQEFDAARISPGLAYSSDTNPNFLSVVQLRNLIASNLSHLSAT